MPYINSISINGITITDGDKVQLKIGAEPDNIEFAIVNDTQQDKNFVFGWTMEDASGKVVVGSADRPTHVSINVPAGQKYYFATVSPSTYNAVPGACWFRAVLWETLGGVQYDTFPKNPQVEWWKDIGSFVGAIPDTMLLFSLGSLGNMSDTTVQSALDVAAAAVSAGLRLTNTQLHSYWYDGATNQVVFQFNKAPGLFLGIDDILLFALVTWIVKALLAFGIYVLAWKCFSIVQTRAETEHMNAEARLTTSKNINDMSNWAKEGLDNPDTPPTDKAWLKDYLAGLLANQTAIVKDTPPANTTGLSFGALGKELTSVLTTAVIVVAVAIGLSFLIPALKK